MRFHYNSYLSVSSYFGYQGEKVTLHIQVFNLVIKIDYNRKIVNKDSKILKIKIINKSFYIPVTALLQFFIQLNFILEKTIIPKNNRNIWQNYTILLSLH